MDVGAAFVTDEQPFHLVEPAEGALDDPAVAAEPGAVPLVAVGDHGSDAALTQDLTVRVGVVATVTEHAVGSLPGPTWTTCDGGDAVKQRYKLGDVVAVAAGHRPRQRGAVGVGQKVVLGARAAPVDRARARFGAPFFAWI